MFTSPANFNPDGFLMGQRNMANLKHIIFEFFRRNQQITAHQVEKNLDKIFATDPVSVRNKAYSLYHSHEGHDEEPSVIEKILEQYRHKYTPNVNNIDPVTGIHRPLATIKPRPK